MWHGKMTSEAHHQVMHVTWCHCGCLPHFWYDRAHIFLNVTPIMKQIVFLELDQGACWNWTQSCPKGARASADWAAGEIQSSLSNIKAVMGWSSIFASVCAVPMIVVSHIALKVLSNGLMAVTYIPKMCLVCEEVRHVHNNLLMHCTLCFVDFHCWVHEGNRKPGLGDLSLWGESHAGFLGSLPHCINCL